MITFLHILAISLSLLLVPVIAEADDLKGKPRVVDGDTICIGETKIRLHGVDAPEMKQTCKTHKKALRWMAVHSAKLMPMSSRRS